VPLSCGSPSQIFLLPLQMCTQLSKCRSVTSSSLLIEFHPTKSPQTSPHPSHPSRPRLAHESSVSVFRPAVCTREGWAVLPRRQLLKEGIVKAINMFFMALSAVVSHPFSDAEICPSLNRKQRKWHFDQKAFFSQSNSPPLPRAHGTCRHCFCGQCV